MPVRRFSLQALPDRMEDIMKIEEAVARVGKDRICQAMESDNADALKNLFDE